MNIVQIGVCEANDDLTQLIDNNQPDKLILVEPLSVHNENILKCYDWVNNKFLENIAILPNHTDEKIDFYYHEKDGPLYEVASINVSHILKHGFDISGVKKLSVDCFTVNELFDKYELKNIDILYIDAEGMDDHIIKSIDFSSYTIDTIYFENLHLNQLDIYNYLKNKGYDITMKTGRYNWNSLAKKI
jgi:hypothetical protein